MCNCDGAPITRAFLLPLPLPALCILNATFFGQQRFFLLPTAYTTDHVLPCIRLMLLLQSYNPYYVCSQYPSDFRAYLPSNYRVERSSPIKLCGVGAVGHGDAISAGNSGRGITNNATSAGSGGHVKCSFPLDNTQLKGIDMPESDWDALIASLWAPWFVELRCVALRCRGVVSNLASRVLFCIFVLG